jgi:tRNA G18 (ribose-2'-O)-methylase SpoU
VSEKVYGLHAVRALLMRHPERVQNVTIVEGRSEPRTAEINKLAAAARVFSSTCCRSRAGARKS